MQFTTTTVFSLLLVASAQAFAPAALPRMTTRMFNSDTHMNKDFTADSGLDIGSVPVLIENLNKDNFVESLEMLEPMLMNECAGDECTLFLSQLEKKCAAIGKSLPEGYAPTHH